MPSSSLRDRWQYCLRGPIYTIPCSIHTTLHIPKDRNPHEGRFTIWHSPFCQGFLGQVSLNRWRTCRAKEFPPALYRAIAMTVATFCRSSLCTEIDSCAWQPFWPVQWLVMGPDYSTGVDSQNESSPCMWSQAALALRLCGITKLLWQIHLDFRCFFIDLHWSWRVVFSISANVLLSCQSADLHPRSLPANWACPANQKMPGHLGFSDRVLLGDTGKEPTYSKPKTEVTFHRKAPTDA